MLTVEIVIKDEQGSVVAKLPPDGQPPRTAVQPQQFKVPPEFPISNVEGSRTEYLWGFTYQPMVTVKLKPTR